MNVYTKIAGVSVELDGVENNFYNIPASLGVNTAELDNFIAAKMAQCNQLPDKLCSDIVVALC